MAELVPGAQTLPIWKDPNATPFIKIKNDNNKEESRRVNLCRTTDPRGGY